MLHSSYEIWGLAVIALLVGVWMVKRIARRIHKGRHADPCPMDFDVPARRSDVEHRALMFLMTQKTDAVLAALARTIEQERQKLGVVVRNPTIRDAVDASGIDPLRSDNRDRPDVDRIIPLVREGMSEAAIARRLKMPETEVAMVRRLYAA